MGGSCIICLCPFKDPVSIPCGHTFCLKCIKGHIQNVTDGFTASCPTCRSDFPIVTPELSCLPKKFHRYVLPSIRRIYFDEANEDSELTEQLAAAQRRIAALERDQEMLMKQCERQIKNSHAHAEGERAARKEAAENKRVAGEAQKDYAFLKHKYENIKRAYRDLRDDKDNNASMSRKRPIPADESAVLPGIRDLLNAAPPRSEAQPPTARRRMERYSDIDQGVLNRLREHGFSVK